MSDRKPQVLVVSWSHLDRDARVRRQIEALRSTYRVHAAGLAASGLENDGFTELPIRPWYEALPGPLRKLFTAGRLLRRWLLRDVLKDHVRAYWDAQRREALWSLGRLRPDLIIANDIDALPLGVALAEGRCPLLYDAHEYSPRQHEGDPRWRKAFGAHYEALCRRLMPKAQAAFTVSAGIADAYAALTGVRPAVLYNAPAHEELSPAPVGEGPIRLVHHGNASKARGTGALITMMDGLRDTHELHLYLTPIGNAAYRREIEGLCAERPNVHLHEAIPPEHIARTINRYDVGVHHLPPDSFNHLHALPNKLFEFVQARLAIAVGPNPAMADLVRRHGLGVVAADHTLDDLRDAIAGLDKAAVEACKRNAHRHAQALSARSGMDLLRGTVRHLLAGGTGAWIDTPGTPATDPTIPGAP